MEYTSSQPASSSSAGRAADSAAWSRNHDGLTGLPNKVLFEAAVDGVIRRSDIAARRLLIVTAALDFGGLSAADPDLRDRTLKAAGKRIAASVRPGDICARTGALEFSALMALAQGEEPREMAARVTAAFSGEEAAIASRHLPDGCSVAARVGAASWPAHGRSAAELVIAAGLAARAVPDGSGFTIFDPARHREIGADDDLGEALGAAIGSGTLGAHFQPVVRIVDGSIERVEALARWLDPVLGFLEPARFIPVAEKKGLIVGVDDAVMRAAFSKGGAWAARAVDPIGLSVNVSPIHLSRGDFAESLGRVLSDASIPPERLSVELAESAILKDLDEAALGLRRLKDLGVSLSVDDFGGRLSSPSALSKLPIDSVKIGLGYVREMESAPRAFETVSAIVGLARRMGIAAVAEGVETAGQFYLLKSIGCDLVQGFLFSEAVPADVLESRYLRRGGGGSPFAFKP